MTASLTPKQLVCRDTLNGSARHIMLFGGARSGKTFLICRNIAIRALKAEGSRHAILRYRLNHLKASIWHDTWPKMMKLCFPDVAYKRNTQENYVSFPHNGAEVWMGGLDDKERTEKILGQEFATVYLNECSQISYRARELMRTRLAQNVGLKLKMYYDCNPPLTTHWTHKIFIEKRHPEPPYELIENPEDYASELINPKDNEGNLPEDYLKELQKLSPRQRARFWEGKFGSASENALWTYETLEKNRTTKHPDFVRVGVAIDPSGTKGEEDVRTDSVGIVVGGLGTDGQAYVLEDLTVKAPPATWGRIAVQAYERHAADFIAAEVNYGGAMVEDVVRSAAAKESIRVNYKEVRASRGKEVRAEPVAALYEQGKVHHVGRFPEMEDELCAFTTAGYMGDRSPNRADALVWLITEIFPGLTRKPKKTKAVIESASSYNAHTF